MLSEGLKNQKGIEEIKNAAGVRLSYLCEVMKELKWAKTRAKSLTDIKLWSELMNTGKTGQGKCIHSTWTVYPAKTEWLKEQLVENQPVI